jgi:hypothetical protein
MKIYAILITVLCIAFLRGFTQDANLLRENVSLKLDSAHLVVTGEYHFKNPLTQPVSQTVFFPYPFERQTTHVDTLVIIDLSDNTLIKPKRKMPNGVFFLLNMDKLEDKKVRVNYTQNHDGQSVTYILESARYLPKPLLMGTYNLKVSDKIVVDSVSIKPDNKGVNDNGTFYQWHKENFKPTRDLIIWFHLRK